MHAARLSSHGRSLNALNERAAFGMTWWDRYPVDIQHTLYSFSGEKQNWFEISMARMRPLSRNFVNWNATFGNERARQ